MAYKRDSVFYIKSLCERTGARYDIENQRYIPKNEDEVDLINYGINRSLRVFAKLFYENGGKETINKCLERVHETRYKTRRKQYDENIGKR